MELDGSSLTNDPGPDIEVSLHLSPVPLNHQSSIQSLQFDEETRFESLDQSTNYYFESGLPRLKSEPSEGTGFNSDFSISHLLSNSELPEAREEPPGLKLAVPNIQQPSNSIADASGLSQGQQDLIADEVFMLELELKANYEKFKFKYLHLINCDRKNPKKTIGLFYKLAFVERKDYLYKKVFRDFRRVVKLALLNKLDRGLKQKPKLGFFEKTCDEKLKIFGKARIEVLKNAGKFEEILAFKGKLTVKVIKGFFECGEVAKVFRIFVEMVFTFVNESDLLGICRMIKADQKFLHDDEIRSLAQDYLEGLLFLI